MIIVTKENQGQYPLPLGCVVKWAHWWRWAEPTTGEEFICFEVRAAGPLPKDLCETLSGLALSALNPKSSFFQVLPVDEEVRTENAPVESAPVTFPYVTYRFTRPATALWDEPKAANA